MVWPCLSKTTDLSAATSALASYPQRRVPELNTPKQGRSHGVNIGGDELFFLNYNSGQRAWLPVVAQHIYISISKYWGGTFWPDLNIGGDVSPPMCIMITALHQSPLWTSHSLPSWDEEVVGVVAVLDGEALARAVGWGRAPTDGLLALDVPHHDAARQGKRHSRTETQYSYCTQYNRGHTYGLRYTVIFDMVLSIKYSLYLPSSWPPKDTRYLSLGEKARPSTFALWSCSLACMSFLA